MKEFFSADEIYKLEHGLPRFSEWSEDLLVPFSVRQLRNAKLAWLNRRWFLERGVDVTDSNTFARVSAWLIATFGYLSPGTNDKAAAFTDRTKVAYADRYGSSGGTAPHGGSGRAAIYDCFQAKGVGVTPMVGINTSPGHAHGCASLEEGIREAIYAEIAAAEFPHGAVPVVAVLDTGMSFSSPDKSEKYDQNVRRGIVIRPCVLRLAHAERAALFDRSVTGYINSQKSDVKRTRDVVRQWSLRGNEESTNDLPSLRQTLGRAAEQAAFGQVHRLFNGGYFSSNLSVTGELLDFGNMHVLPDWVNARVLGHTAGFGKESQAIDLLAKSLDFYFKKYSEPENYRESAQSLNEYAQACYRKAFAQECLRLWQAESLAGSGAGDEIVRLIQAYFSNQQRQWRRYEFGHVVDEKKQGAGEWLYTTMVRDGEETGARNDEPAARVLEAIGRCLRLGFQSAPGGESRLWVSWLTALRLLQPRVEIDRGTLLQRIHDRASRLDFARTDGAERVTALIRDAVDQGRRHWPRLPEELGVISHLTWDGCSVLLCSKGPQASRMLWVEAVAIGDRVCVFGNWLSIKELAEHGARLHGVYCTFLVPESEKGQEGGYLLRLGPHEIQVPEMSSGIPLNVAEKWCCRFELGAESFLD